MKTKSIENIIKDTIYLKSKEYTAKRFREDEEYEMLENVQMKLLSISTPVTMILILLFVYFKQFLIVGFLGTAYICILIFIFSLIRKQIFIENKYRYFDSLKTREIWKKKNDKNKRY